MNKELKTKARQLRESGVSIIKIARELSVSKSTVSAWVNEEENVRIPTVNEREAIKSLVYKKLMRDDYPSEILRQDPGDPYLHSEETYKLASAEITDQFREKFHLWIPSTIY